MEKLTENMIRWAESKLGSPEYPDNGEDKEFVLNAEYRLGRKIEVCKGAELYEWATVTSE